MTLDEIKKHQLYARLSSQQQVYVIARCLGKDKIEAAKEAWKGSTEASFEAMANRAESNGNIRWLYNEFLGGNLPTREDVIKQAWDISKAAPEFRDKLNALKIVANISGFESAPPPPPPKEDDGEEPFDEG